jgi:hypothetical protein
MSTRRSFGVGRERPAGWDHAVRLLHGAQPLQTATALCGANVKLVPSGGGVLAWAPGRTACDSCRTHYYRELS